MAQGSSDKPEIVALTKIDALTPEVIKQQTARLKRAGQEDAAAPVGGDRRRRARGDARAVARHRSAPAANSRPARPTAWQPRIDLRRNRRAPCHALGVHPKAHARQRAGATMVVARRRSLAASNHVPKAPALTDFRRIVVKVGSSLLVDATAGRLQRGVACRARRRHRRPCIATSATSSWSRPARSRSAARCSSCRRDRSSSRTARPPPPSARSRWPAPGPRCSAGIGITAGQILVTLHDTEERRRYLNARSTIDKLLEWRSVPVINENDTVATNEIRYGDNDRLAARVATMASADLLVLLSDIDGLYDAPPPQSARQADSAGGAHHARDRSHGGRGRLRALARRHADQDRSRQDRHHGRHPHGDRLRPRRPSARCDRQTARAAPGSSRRPIRSPRARSGSRARSSPRAP